MRQSERRPDVEGFQLRTAVFDSDGGGERGGRHVPGDLDLEYTRLFGAPDGGGSRSVEQIVMRLVVGEKQKPEPLLDVAAEERRGPPRRRCGSSPVPRWSRLWSLGSLFSPSFCRFRGETSLALDRNCDRFRQTKNERKAIFGKFLGNRQTGSRRQVSGSAAGSCAVAFRRTGVTRDAALGERAGGGPGVIGVTRPNLRGPRKGKEGGGSDQPEQGYRTMPATALITRWSALHAEEPDDLLAACQSHVQSHGTALTAAARHAAGAPGARLAQRLCDDIAAAGCWQAGFTRRMRGLQDLLRLEHPDDPEQLYPGPAAVFEPGAARGAECRWHADLLEALIARGEAIAARAVPLPRAPLRRPMRTA